MTTIKIDDDTIQMDAGVLARAFHTDANSLKQQMRDGTLTSRFERGEGADAGRVRLSFYAPGRRVRMIAATDGRILTCSAANYARPLPGLSEPAAKDGPDDAARKERLDALLDLALQGTFPASDPTSPDLGRND